MAQAHLAATLPSWNPGLTQPQAPRCDGTSISRTGVLVGRDGYEFQHPFSSSSIQTLGPQVYQH